MKKASWISSSLLMFIIFMLTSNVSAQRDDKKLQAAQAAEETWLSLVDAGKYDESYKTSATAFQSAISNEKWVNAVQGARGPLGQLKERTLKSATYTKSLPGAPDGEYEVILYTAHYANKETATETVTAMIDKDGAWRVVGYYIK